MDPFHVTCETCHARLKIRSESVIGEIHACPKCESMVHVVPPHGWVPSTAAVAAAASSSAEISVEVKPTEVPVAAAGSSFFVWSVGGAAIALLMVAGLAFAMWPRGEEPALVAVAAVNEPVVTPDQAVVESPAENSPPDSVIRDTNDAPEPDPVETVAAVPTPPELLVDEVAVTSPAATESSDPPAIAPPATDANDKKPVLKFDPLDFDPARLSLGGATAPQPAEASSSVADTNDEPVVVQQKDDLPADAKPDEPAVGDPSVTVRIGPGATDALRSRNVAEQLGLKVESLDVADVPMAQFADMVSDIGNVPVTIDPSALVMAGLSSRTNVAVQARGTTLDKLLRDVLTKQRLDYVERDGQVVIIHPSRDTRRGVDYEVTDLLESDAKDATALSELIVRFVAPESWHGEANSGAIRVDGTKLHVDQVNQVQIQILLFCERLRLARGLGLKSKYPAERLAIESPYVTLSDKLGKSTTFTFLPWTRLADVVRRWQESTGVTILVDWEELAKEELAPATPIACSAINRPWDAALDAVLEPLGLAWWAVDGETIQITSRAALTSIERIEFYAVPKPMLEMKGDGRQLSAALEAKVRELAAAGDGPANATTHIAIEAMPGGRFIVLASPIEHRRLAASLHSPPSQ